MIDSDLEKNLKEINSNLIEIKKRSRPGIWRAFFNGIFSALGYLVGLTLVLVALGWFLNQLGILQAFQQQLSGFQNMISDFRKSMSPQPQQSSGTTVVLPNGQQIKIK